MEYLVAGALLWALAAGYLVWRIRRGMRRLLPTVPEMTWLIYLVVFTLFSPLISFLGERNRTIGIVLLAVAFLVSLVLSYRANARYQAWRKEQQDKQEEA